MKYRNPAQLVLFFALLSVLLSILFVSQSHRVTSQTRPRIVSDQANAKPDVDRTTPEIVKVDVDLITVNALVLQKDTARIVGGLNKEDFTLYEDGAKQTITHFSQDSLPLSVLLLIDRGGCLDPFGEQVHRAASDAIARLKPVDEVAVMTYHDTTRLLQGFTRDRSLIEDALNQVPKHDEQADHCLNKLFADAADYDQSKQPHRPSGSDCDHRRYAQL
jgi:VWFA-related protein